MKTGHGWHDALKMLADMGGVWGAVRHGGMFTVGGTAQATNSVFGYLETFGLVERLDNAPDAYMHDWRITRKGLELLARLAPSAR